MTTRPVPAGAPEPVAHADLARPAATPAPAFPIRLIALDVDGTLVDHDLVLHPRTREAVAAAMARGVRVSLATGRGPRSAGFIARQLGLVDPIVGYQGAIIRDMPPAPEPGGRQRRGRLRFHRPLPADVTRDALRWCSEHGLEPHLNHLDRIIVREDDPRYDDYSTFLGSRPHGVPDLVAWTVRPVTKVIALGPEGLPMRLVAQARRDFAGRADATVSHPWFLEFVAPGVSKGSSLARLARWHGIPLANALAIGDSLNDHEMIGAVGHGTAMPTAPAVVRAGARYVAPPLGEQGVAQMIEQLVLAGDAAPGNARRLAEAARASLAGAPAEPPPVGDPFAPTAA